MQNVRNQQCFAEGEPVLVAVSGGLDSMVLLDLLLRMPPEARGPLFVAHFNHKLRGEASERDEQFVVETARQHGLEFITDQADVRAEARRGRVSIEMAARRLRHDFFVRSAAKFGVRTILLAHHADDQVETFWLRLLRGNAGQGLSGMRWKGPSPADPAFTLARPLLNVTKAEIAAYAREKQVAFQEDYSNAHLQHQRNRIRHEVLPALEKYQPRLREVTLRLAAVLSEEKDYLREQTRDAEIAQAHPAIQREFLLGQLRQAGVTATFERIERLRTSREPVMIAPGRIARFDGSRLHIEQIDSEPWSSEEYPVRLDPPCSLIWKGLSVSVELGSRAEPRPGLEQFDADLIGPDITLRHWRHGDRFRPIGLPRAVKVQDLFTNLKIPVHERHARVVATIPSGEIFWIEGLRISERAKITEQTTRILRWSWQR